MESKREDEEKIPWEMLQELMKHLERTEFWGKVELLFQGRLVRIHQSQPMKKGELRRFLNREKRIDSHTAEGYA